MHPIDVAVAHYGSLTKLASVVGLTPQGMSYRRRHTSLTFSAEEALRIHNDSGIPLHVLRPDVWQTTEINA